MYRFLLTPRWLAIAAATVLAVLACVSLGIWQWHRAHTELPGTTLTLADARPLEEVLGSDRALDPTSPPIAIAVSGEYDAAQQRVIRNGAGPRRDLVAAPLVEADGNAVLVARGWIPAGDPVPAAPPGTVEVRGWAQIPEPVDPSDLVGGAAGELPALTPVPYLDEVAYSLANAVVALQEQTPPVVGVTPLPPPSTQPVRRTNWRSLGYSVQWFVFAGFVVFLFVRGARTEARERTAEPAAEPVTPA